MVQYNAVKALGTVTKLDSYSLFKLTTSVNWKEDEFSAFFQLYIGMQELQNLDFVWI